MEKIISKIDGSLLHLIFRESEFNVRQELIAPNEHIQAAAIEIPEDHTFPAHRHILKDIPVGQKITQEAWVVISGVISIDYFDLNDQLIETKTLSAGDCTITLRGGHRYHSKTRARVYEFKTGPYLGRDNDKVLI